MMLAFSQSVVFAASIVHMEHAALPTAAQQTQPATAVWTIARTPLADIGGSAADPRDQLGLVVAAARFANGQIAVLDALIPAVRVYSSDGTHQRDLGRAGQGPGEFGEVIAFAAVGDTAVVLDRSGAGEYITSDGKNLRSTNTLLAGYLDPRFNARPAGVLPDGAVLVRAEERLYGRVRGEYRQTVGLLRVTGGAVQDTIGWFRGDSIRTDAGGNPVPRPYLPETGLLWSGAGGSVFVATADAAAFTVITRNQRRTVECGARRQEVIVSDADVALIADEWTARGITANDRRVIREYVEGRPRLRTAPYFRSLVAASEEEVWLETWTRRGPESEWLVCSATGLLKARVYMPSGLKVQAVGADWVLGVERDGEGAQRVRVYGLQRF